MNHSPTQPGREDPDSRAVMAPPAPGAITLARHGRPDADRTVRINAKGYGEWWANYDRVGLREDSKPPRDLIEAVKKADILLASTLPRAIATAHAVAEPERIETLPIFVEAPLPPPPLPGLFLKPPTWGVLSRIAWWLGYSGGTESRREAEVRAESAADHLVQTAASGAEVLLFAHGWFNRMLRPALKRRGYDCVVDGGDSYWSYRRYEPVQSRVDAADAGR